MSLLTPDVVRRRRLWLTVLILACAGLVGGWIFAQATAGAVVPEAAASQPAVEPAAFYGAWVLTPAILTIVLAIVMRQVLPALSLGIFIAALMLAPFQSADGYSRDLIGALRLSVERYLCGALTDASHVKVIVFTLLIAGMVGVIAVNGGTGRIVAAVARWARTRRQGQVATWFAGLLVFFDDYANAMIVGPAMGPVCDRLRISRAKLAYIVDTTAAPVSSLALISTWIGTEVGYIQDGLKSLHEVPAFMQGATLDGGYAYGVFLASLPYRFYPILALLFVLLIALFNRDFGPMHRAEQEVGAAPPPQDAAAEHVHGRAWYAAVPVLVLIGVTLSLLVITGWQKLHADGKTSSGLLLISDIFANSDSYNALVYGALAALTVAGAISLGTGTLTLAETVEGCTRAMGHLLPTILVLVLAWTISAAIQDLQLGVVARDLLQHTQFDVRWLPLLVFASACVVSFATGTSWGTMGLLCPAVVTIAGGLLVHDPGHDYPGGDAASVFYASVGAVLAGAVFGDHCSPISDTTVLSAAASGCTLELHVWTQMPYALVVALVGMISGDFLCRFTVLPAWGALLVGAAALVVIIWLLGRKVRTAGEAQAKGQS